MRVRVRGRGRVRVRRGLGVEEGHHQQEHDPRHGLHDVALDDILGRGRVRVRVRSRGWCRRRGRGRGRGRGRVWGRVTPRRPAANSRKTRTWMTATRKKPTTNQVSGVISSISPAVSAARRRR